MLKTQHSFSSFINSIAASVFYVLHTFKNALVWGGGNALVDSILNLYICFYSI